MQQNIRNTGMVSPLEKLYDCMVTGTLGIMSAAAEQFINQIELTDNEKEILKKYSYKIFWCTVLEKYVEGEIALNFKEKYFLQRTLTETNNTDLIIKLNKFLNNINKTEAKKLRKDICDGIPKDALEDFYNIVYKFSKSYCF